MPITKEYRCKAHGPFEAFEPKCPGGKCPKSWIVQEIRTAPAYRRSGKMRFIDDQLKGIARDAGLSDMRTGDPGESVLSKVKKTPADLMPRWGEVPHAAPGFSREGGKAPVVSASTFGTQPSAASKIWESPPPPPKPIYQGRPKD